MVSEKCLKVLRGKPNCRDKKEKMRHLMCYARKLQEEGYDYSSSMKQAWKNIRQICSL